MGVFTITMACIGGTAGLNKKVTEGVTFSDTGEIYGVGDAGADQDARTTGSLNTYG